MSPERESLVRSLFETFVARYALRDESLLGMFGETFSGYTVCGEFLVHDRDRWAEIVRADFSEAAFLRIDVIDLTMQDLAENVVSALALFHLHLPDDDPLVARELLRLFLVFRREAGEWKVAHSSYSAPYHLRDADRIFPLDSLAARAAELERLVEERTARLERANSALETLSYTDDLTGIANRRAFDRRLREEWRRARRGETPLALLMLDLDNFKHYNDRYGHLAGDRCLERIARLLAGSVRRAGDLTARFGGEEFVVLLPGVDADEAHEVAMLILRKIRALALPHEETATGIVTVSIGIAGEIPAGGDPLDLVRRADAALYRAKRAGRNRIAFEIDDAPFAVRPAHPGEAAEIAALIDEAFRDTAHACGFEGEVFLALRRADALVVSLVAEVDGVLVGQVAASPLSLDGAPGWAGIGPLAVRPGTRGHGVGTRLMAACLAALEEAGFKGAVLVGDPAYYGRFGFSARPGLIFPGAPAENVLGLAFGPEEPRGVAAFHPAFDVAL